MVAIVFAFVAVLLVLRIAASAVVPYRILQPVDRLAFSIGINGLKLSALAVVLFVGYAAVSVYVVGEPADLSNQAGRIAP